MTDPRPRPAPPAEQLAKRQQYAIYKPTRNNTGGVLRLHLVCEKDALFAESARQDGEKSFDWQRKITMKWGLGDIGEVLAVLERRQREAKLFHKTEKQSTTFQIRHQAEAERNNYFAQMTKQVAETKEVTRVAIPLSQGEAAVLATLLRTATVRLAGW